VLRRRLRCRARRPVASRGARTAGLRLGAAATPTTSTSPPPPTPSTAKLSPDSPPRPPTMPLPTAWRAPPANSPPGNSPTLRATRGRLVPGACEPSRAPPALRVERTASASAPVDLASYPSWPRVAPSNDRSHGHRGIPVRSRCGRGLPFREGPSQFPRSTPGCGRTLLRVWLPRVNPFSTRTPSTSSRMGRRTARRVGVATPFASLPWGTTGTRSFTMSSPTGTLVELTRRWS
jgi:hypothetical protein